MSFLSCWIASIGCNQKFFKESLICQMCVNGCDLSRVMRWSRVHLEVVFYFYVFFSLISVLYDGCRK